MKNISFHISQGEQFVSPISPQLQYSGRIDFSNILSPIFIYPYSSISTIFTGTSIKILVQNHHQYWDNYLGYTLDGVQGKVLLPKENNITCITLAENLEDKEHHLFLFKRMDACHHFTLHGLILLEQSELKRPSAKPVRKMEFYGDSITAGEVAEAIDYIEKEDPNHNGEYSNSWYSYATITARKLNAQIHTIAQGGIALLDKTGYFHAPNYIGMETAYDKLSYNTDIAPSTLWDFRQYTPQVVVVAIGQNDNHPKDYMKEDYSSKYSVAWRNHYKTFIHNLRNHYPTSTIILKTSIMYHDVSWDNAIEEVCRQIDDPKIHHFLYQKNGIGTPGHIRISEAEQMANELVKFIESLGDDIWI